MKKSRKFRLTPSEVVASAEISVAEHARMLDMDIAFVSQIKNIHAVIWPNGTQQLVDGDPEDRPSWEIYVLKAYILAMRIKRGWNWYWLRNLHDPFG